MSSRAQLVEKDLGTLAWLRSIYFVGNDGWLVGSKGTIFRSKDGGTTWKRFAWKSEDLIRDVFFADPNTGWLLCERDRFSYQSGSASYLMQTLDGGETWTEMPSPDESIRMLAFVHSPGKLGFVVGEKGTTWHFNAELKRWTTSNVGVPFLLSGGTNLGAKEWMIVGGGGTILKTSNDGSAWETMSFPGEQRVKLNAVIVNDGKLFAVGNKGKIIYSADMGKQWQPVESGTTNDLLDIKAVGKEKLVIVGDVGTVLTSIDNGRTWKSRSIKKGRLEKIGITAEDRAIFVGFGKLIELESF